jgi:hypothetical protein
MLRITSLMILCLALASVVGCGGSQAPTNVAEDADAKAIADYEAAVAAESAGMNTSDAK